MLCLHSKLQSPGWPIKQILPNVRSASVQVLRKKNPKDPADTKWQRKVAEQQGLVKALKASHAVIVREVKAETTNKLEGGGDLEPLILEENYDLVELFSKKKNHSHPTDPQTVQLSLCQGTS